MRTQQKTQHQSPFDRIIFQLWKERMNLVKWNPNTEEEKKHQREKLKIVTDDLHKFCELLVNAKLEKNEQQLELMAMKKKVAKEVRLQHESDVGFVDTDGVDY